MPTGAHPSVDEVMRFAAGLGGSADLERHLETCAACALLVELGHGDAATDSGAHPDLTALRRLDRSEYTDWQPIADGGGGMGRTWRARDRRLGRWVVIKEPLDSPVFGDDLDPLHRRFEREVRVTARLYHPAIVVVYQAGRWEDGRPFYAMPFVDGTPLDRELDARADLPRRLELLPTLVIVAEAVAYAHSEGVIHRDIKPQNILVGPFGETVLIDWGLAKDLRAAADADASPGAELPTDGATAIGIGTPQYMPPEQALGKTPTTAFDVYALGATLYHLLTGSPPYGRGDTRDIRRQLLSEPPRPPHQLEPRVPPALASLVATSMARDPDARLAGAREFADELNRFLRGQLTLTHEHTAGDVLRHWARKHRAALRVAVIALLGLALFAAVAIRGVVAERDRATRAQVRAESSEARAVDELARAHGAIAMLLARQPARRLEALVHAVDAANASRPESRPREAVQGLFDALTVGPTCAPLSGHRGLINDAAFTGDRLVTVGLDHTIRVWDLASGRHRILRSQQSNPYDLTISHDGTHAIVTQYLGEPPELWNLTSGELHRLDGGASSAPHAVFLAGGTSLAVAGFDGHVRVWDLDGRLQRDIDLGDAVSALTTRIDGALIAATRAGSIHVLADGGDAAYPVTEDAIVGVFERASALVAVTRSGTVLRWSDGVPDRATATVIDTDLQLVREAELSPDGRWLALMSSPEAIIFDLEERRTVDVGTTLRGARFSPDSTHAVTWSEGRGRILDLVNHRVQARLELDTLAVAAAAFDHTGERVVAATVDGAACVWPLDRRSATELGFHRAEVTGLVASRDRLITASVDGEVSVWDPVNRARIATLQLPAGVTASGPLPRDAGMAVGGDDGTLRIVDRGGRIAAELAGHTGPITAVASTADGDRVMTTSLDGSAAVWDVASGRALVHLSGHRGAVTAGALADGGRRAITAGADGDLVSWDVASAQIAKRVSVGAPVDGVHVSADGITLAVGTVSGETFVFRAADLSLERRLEGRLPSPGTSPFLSDGAIATVSADGVVLVTGDDGATRELSGHSRSVVAAFAAGAQLATASLDGNVRLWRRDDDGEPLRLTGPSGLAVTAAATTADPHWLAVAYSDYSVHLVPVDVDAALAQACRILAALDRHHSRCDSTSNRPNHILDR